MNKPLTKPQARALQWWMRNCPYPAYSPREGIRRVMTRRLSAAGYLAIPNGITLAGLEALEDWAGRRYALHGCEAYRIDLEEIRTAVEAARSGRLPDTRPAPESAATDDGGPLWLGEFSGRPAIRSRRGVICTFEAGYQTTRERDARETLHKLKGADALSDAVRASLEFIRGGVMPKGWSVERVADVLRIFGAGPAL